MSLFPNGFFSCARIVAASGVAFSFTVQVFGVRSFGDLDDVPETFPRFVVPGYEEEMEAFRELFYLHYEPGMKVGTLWDEWLPHSMIWAAVDPDRGAGAERAHWREQLAGRTMTPDGYVATHQHTSIAHQHGWPFPFWRQGEAGGAWGWHFSLRGVPDGWHHTEVKDREGWRVEGGRGRGTDEEGWILEITDEDARVETPPLEIDPYQAPFLQLRWRADGLGEASPVIEWIREGDDDYSAERRFSFSLERGDETAYTVIPVFRSPVWNDKISRLRIRFRNSEPGEVLVQALFTQYDTRHNVNNTKWIKGCVRYFSWTRDLEFLRDRIRSLRRSLHYMMVEHNGLEENLILTDWVGHEGRPGFTVHDDGEKTFHYGSGIGNNYWDLVPFGWEDTYATIHYYDALRKMADLEEAIERHPEWNIPGGPERHDPEFLRSHAEAVKQRAGRRFWNDETGRFVSNIDKDGVAYDYGFTFVNLEAIHYGLADRRQADRIMDWISGERTVTGDTSRGDDIYRWRFGPRSTTRRNVDYYGWYWTAPEDIAWGGQVQDGGAVLGFSYHDLSARLKIRGPDDAWNRLREIAAWFRDVREHGGYRPYYEAADRGTTLQGGGTAGGLGVDFEFKESVLLPQVLLYDFLGFRPVPEGFRLRPRLPGEWPSLTVDRIHFRNTILEVTASENKLRIQGETVPQQDPVFLFPDEGTWQVIYRDASGEIESSALRRVGPDDGVLLRVGDGRSTELIRNAEDGR